MTGHVGISANDAADSIAMEAFLQGNFIPYVLNLDFKDVHHSLLCKLQWDWDHTQGS
jgi:hypothetical protein